MSIGRRIYYSKSTGEFICDTGEREGNVKETTVSADFKSLSALRGRLSSNTPHIELKPGEYAAEFATKRLSHIEDGRLIFVDREDEENGI